MEVRLWVRPEESSNSWKGTYVAPLDKPIGKAGKLGQFVISITGIPNDVIPEQVRKLYVATADATHFSPSGQRYYFKFDELGEGRFIAR